MSLQSAELLLKFRACSQEICGKAQCTENQAVRIQRRTIFPFLLLLRALYRKKIADATSISISIKNKGKTWNDG